jgi:hypothetical protein
MYTRQTAEELETSRARAGDDLGFPTAQQICPELRGISLMTPCRWSTSDVVRFAPPIVGISDHQYWEAGNIRHSSTLGTDVRDGSSNAADRAGSLEQSISV